MTTKKKVKAPKVKKAKVARKGRKHVNAIACSYNGIAFKSGLERFTYIELEANGLNPAYEPERWIILPAFTYKGEKIRGISYRADFVFFYNGIKYILETKGRANEAWPNRLKLIKIYLLNHIDWEYVILKNEVEVKQYIQKIKL